CIEIVSGASEMFGIKIAKNFNQPFFSRSINEFWRRWHITLGLWLKEYVFYPVSLSGSFKKVNGFVSKHIKSEHLVKMIPAAYALFFVWFCNGIWHGASGKYIFYGLYYYVLMMLGEFTKPFTDKLCAKLKINREAKPYHLFQMIRTFIIINIGMLIFRSATIGESTHLFFSMFKSVNIVELFNGTFTIENITSKDYFILAVCVLVLFVIGLLNEKNIEIRKQLASKPFILRWLIYFVLIFATIILGIYGGNYGNAAMIYGQF
ncbi:MAG: MBOAT family protein, partial [Clostridium sp.]|nr:MBOAT family protein [Clostridium sp.]